MMDNTIAYNDAQEWLVKNGYEYKELIHFQATNGKTYFEYRSNAGLIYRLPTLDGFDKSEQKMFINYMKGNTKMKTTFTLQDILSIKKDTWLEFIKSKMSDDEKKAMQCANDRWKVIATANNGDLLIDQYSINISSKTICLNFYDDRLFLTHCGASDDFIKFNASTLSLNDLMKIITQLVIVLYNLDAGDPVTIANKVVEMLNEMINNQTQGNQTMENKITLEQLTTFINTKTDLYFTDFEYNESAINSKDIIILQANYDNESYNAVCDNNADSLLKLIVKIFIEKQYNYLFEYLIGQESETYNALSDLADNLSVGDFTDEELKEKIVEAILEDLNR